MTEHLTDPGKRTGQETLPSFLHPGRWIGFVLLQSLRDGTLQVARAQERSPLPLSMIEVIGTLVSASHMEMCMGEPFPDGSNLKQEILRTYWSYERQSKGHKG